MKSSPILFRLLCLSVAAVLAACSGQGTPANTSNTADPYESISGNFNPAWAQDKLWDDGLAEVAVYEAERVIYGKPRQFEYTLITVKEEFNRAYNVKTDDYSRPDLFPVMKVNAFARIPTDNYPYHFLTSVFVHRNQPWALHKLTVSSQEWCGNTFKSITDEGAHFKQYYHAYFDGQGEGSRELPKNILTEDQLPYTLRALNFADGLRFNANMLELQQTNKANAPAVYKATITTDKTTVNGEEAWQVNVQLGDGKTNSYWFSGQYPNYLLKQRTWDGRSLTLKKVSRYAYWEQPKL